MKGDAMPGVFEVSRRVTVRSAVDDIILLSECSNPGEWAGQGQVPATAVALRRTTEGRFPLLIRTNLPIYLIPPRFAHCFDAHLPLVETARFGPPGAYLEELIIPRTH
jgi:hypothetical protein